MKNSRPKIYIKRNLEEKIKKYLADPEILAIIGPRQSGKTTILKHISSRLKDTNFITLENIKTLELFDEDIYSFIEQNVKGYKYLFIDEIQYSEKAGKNLKYIYDTEKIKILITGSSSTELSFRGLKYLTGRVLIFNLFPLSFEEFIRFKNKRVYNSIHKNKLSEALIKEVMPYFKDFVIYGGYPRVVLENDNSKKEKILENIYNIFMLREVGEILGIKDRKKLSNLLKILSLQTSKLINYTKLSDETKYSYHDLQDNLNILEETFICNRVNPFYTNKKLEIVKNPKIFFYDNGLRNSVIGNFSKERSDMGELYENFVFCELIKKGVETKFWRSKSKAEVDFVVKKNEKIIPFEVKTKIYKTNLTKSFISFLNTYKPEEGYFLSENFIGEKKFRNINVKYLPLFSIYKIL